MYTYIYTIYTCVLNALQLLGVRLLISLFYSYNAMKSRWRNGDSEVVLAAQVHMALAAQSGMKTEFYTDLRNVAFQGLVWLDAYFLVSVQFFGYIFDLFQVWFCLSKRLDAEELSLVQSCHFL